MDPSSGWFNSDVLTLEELRDAPCIGLLGEVGMGKTIAVRQEATNIQSAMDPDVSADRINLGLLSDGAELRDALAGSDAVRRWREDGAVVHLLLDGLDEFVARFQRGRSALVEEVERLAGDRERLRLRVASRSAFWTPGFSNDLASAFGVEHLPLWHLAPLRTEDVVLAASDVGVESSAFLREVRRLDAGPLAARPVTLRFLLDLYASKGSFPSRRYELFEEGCRHLAEEHDEEVRESAELDLDESLALASRVAAANVFTGRPEIWLGKQAVEAPPGSISILELAGGKEALLRAGDTAVEASGENLRSVLRSTGLFASPGDNHATWAHASYAEFLAARFVQQRGLSPAQIESLLLQTGADGQRRLAPQLVETAGWIASVRPATFRMLMQSDPESLLRSDALDVSDDERRALVEELLARHDREDLDLVYTRMRLNLVHPGLAAQLTPYIDSDTHSLTARRFAVRLAAEAGVSALAEPILCVALNRNEPLGLREHAADAIVELRDGTTIETLRRFIEPGDATDERQALRASALRGLWPDRLSTEDVFASLAPPRPDMATRYSAFVGHTFPTGLTEADLPIALRWAKDANVDGTGEQPFERLIEAICTRAWEAEQETVQELLADVLTNQLDVRRESWSEDSLRVAVDASPERRRTMLGRIVRRLAQRQKGTLAIFWSRINWLRSGDATWMCNRLTSTDDTREKQAWVELIVRIWSGDHAETITILETATTEPLLLKALTPAMAVVELDSADALTQRQHWEMSTSAATPPPQHDEADKLRPALEAAKTGERDAWVHLIQLMDSVAHDDEPPRTGAWMPAFGRVAERLDAADKSSVVEGCRRFLCEGSPPGGDSLPGRTWGEVTAYRSLLLLSHLDPNALASLPSEIWIRWAPAIAGHEPTYAREFEGDVLRLAREHAQQALLSNLAGALAAEIGASRRARAHIRFVTLDEKYVSQLLLAIAADTRTPGDAVRDLLIPLLDCGSEPAWRAALEITRPGS